MARHPLAAFNLAERGRPYGGPISGSAGSGKLLATGHYSVRSLT
jgi:hypothetical protein